MSTNRKVHNRARGYILLAVIFALMILAISLTTALPSLKTQTQRELELEAYFRGQQMAEAIARYYGRGRLSPAGLTVSVARPRPGDQPASNPRPAPPGRDLP